MKIRYYDTRSIIEKIEKIIKEAQEEDLLDKRVPILEVVNNQGEVLFAFSVAVRGTKKNPYFNITIQGLPSNREVFVRPIDITDLIRIIKIITKSEKAEMKLQEVANELEKLRSKYVRKSEEIEGDRDGLRIEGSEESEEEEEPGEESEEEEEEEQEQRKKRK